MNNGSLLLFPVKSAARNRVFGEGLYPAQREPRLPIGPSAADERWNDGFACYRNGGLRCEPEGMGSYEALDWLAGFDDARERDWVEARVELERAEALDALNDAEAARMAEEAEWGASYESGYAHC